MNRDLENAINIVFADKPAGWERDGGSCVEDQVGYSGPHITIYDENDGRTYMISILTPLVDETPEECIRRLQHLQQRYRFFLNAVTLAGCQIKEAKLSDHYDDGKEYEITVATHSPSQLEGLVRVVRHVGEMKEE